MSVYKKHFLGIEFLISIIFVLLSYFLINYFKLNYFLDSTFYSVIATISGTLSGLTITSITILITTHNSNKLFLVRKSKLYSRIYNIFFETIGYLGSTTIVSIIGILFKITSVWFFYSLLWLITISTFRLYRCVWILKNIIQILVSNKD